MRSRKALHTTAAAALAVALTASSLATQIRRSYESGKIGDDRKYVSSRNITLTSGVSKNGCCRCAVCRWKITQLGTGNLSPWCQRGAWRGRMGQRQWALQNSADARLNRGALLFYR